MKLFLTLFISLTSSMAFAATKAAPTTSNQTSVASANVSSTTDFKLARAVPHLGIVMSSLSGVDAAGSQTKTGFEFGGLFEFGQKKTVFETGVLYRQLGAYGTSTLSGTSIDTAFEAEYFSVPLNAKYYVQGQKENSLFLKGGIMPSILAAKKIKQSVVNGPTGSTDDVRMSNFDLSVVMGLGGRFVTSEKSSLLLEAAYTRGLTNVFETTSNLYNSAFAFTAGFAIDM